MSKTGKLTAKKRTKIMLKKTSNNHLSIKRLLKYKKWLAVGFVLLFAAIGVYMWQCDLD